MLLFIQPYAFDSRDFFRKLVVGKDVNFTPLYKVPTTNREYGTITLPTGQSLIELALAEGMVKLREDVGKREDQQESETLIEKFRELESNARAGGKGVWGATEDGQIDSRYEAPSEPLKFLEKYKGKPINSKILRPWTLEFKIVGNEEKKKQQLTQVLLPSAIIERVISGDRVAIRLLLEPKLHQQMILLIAGIRAPLSKRIDSTGSEQAAEEFGDFAKDYVESRLLQRFVKVTLLGLSPQLQFIGNIIHPAGNIAELLLSQGLARCVDFHSTMIGPDMSKLRAAEKAARDAKLRLWKEHIVKAKAPNSSNLDAVVSRVLSADTIFVRNKAGDERKINLSSIRQPKYIPSATSDLLQISLV